MPFERFKKDVSALVGENARLLEKPRDQQADLALPCFSLAKKYQKPPHEIASMMAAEIAGKIRKNSFVLKAEAAGPYVNFFINPEKFCPMVIKEIIAKKGKYGSSSLGRGKIVVIDYSSPNIAKPMSVGHLRSTLIGQSLCNIHKFLGYRVIGDNHLGDWGTQFGKLLYAYKAWGDPAKIKENPMSELLSLYVKFHEEAEKNPELENMGREWFSRLEKGDAEAVKLWKYFVKLSMIYFKGIYSRLGVSFDLQLGESFYVPAAKQVIKTAVKKGVAKQEQNAIIIPMNGTPLLIQKSDESTLYATRDLATLDYRMKKFHPAKILYVVGAEQSLNFRQLFHSARLLHLVKDEPVHVSFGLVSLPEGRMSTRKGRVVFLEDLLDETLKHAAAATTERAIKDKRGVAEKIAIAAVKYNNLATDRVRDIIFDWEQALAFEGDTGPYLLYTAVRAKSILEKSGKKPSTAKFILSTKEEVELTKALSLFPTVLQESLSNYKPHVLANYLYATASMFNEYYHKTKIIGSDQETSRLALVKALRIVMENGLQLLGIDIPDKM